MMPKQTSLALMKEEIPTLVKLEGDIDFSNV
jgi:hypothetical protein